MISDPLRKKRLHSPVPVGGQEAQTKPQPHFSFFASVVAAKIKVQLQAYDS